MAFSRDRVCSQPTSVCTSCQYALFFVFAWSRMGSPRLIAVMEASTPCPLVYACCAVFPRSVM
jgi:hypothetical protein